MDPQGWRPIETAPMDGREILVRSDWGALAFASYRRPHRQRDQDGSRRWFIVAAWGAIGSQDRLDGNFPGIWPQWQFDEWHDIPPKQDT